MKLFDLWSFDRRNYCKENQAKGPIELINTMGPADGIIHVWGEERKPTRCNNIDDLLSIMDVDY